jgi:hypothetical protein
MRRPWPTGEGGGCRAKNKQEFVLALSVSLYRSSEHVSFMGISNIEGTCTNHKNSEMYVADVLFLFFHILSLQFDTLFVAIHKLPDSIRESGFGPSNKYVHGLFYFFVTAKPKTTSVSITGFYPVCPSNTFHGTFFKVCAT